MQDYDPWSVAAHVRSADRWRSASTDWGCALTEALLDCANLQRSSVVLDVAAGSGDPALAIARRVPEGRVVALDSSRPALFVAKAQADEMGLMQTIQFVQADAHSLPFLDRCFDRVTCRCGIMFFAAVDVALSEILRVLKSGGRAALLAWGSFEQPVFESTIGAILRLVPGTTVPPPAQAMFKFAGRGLLHDVLRRAGFRGVDERHLTFPRIWAGSPEDLWEYFQEVSTPFHPLFEAVPASVRAEIDAAVSAALCRFQTANTITVPAQVVLAIAER